MVLNIRDSSTVSVARCTRRSGHARRRPGRARHVVSGDEARSSGCRSSRSEDPRRPDILICCVDGLAGLSEAIEAIFPTTTFQMCLVHLIRSSLNYVPAARARAGHPRSEADLHRQGRRSEAGRARDLRRELRPAVPGHHQGVAGRLGVRDPVPGVPRRGRPRDLHHARDRSAQPAVTQGDQDQGQLPNEDAARGHNVTLQQAA